MNINNEYDSDVIKSSKSIDHNLNLSRLRNIFSSFIFLFFAFAFTDLIFYPDHWELFWILRLGVAIPLFISTIILSYKPIFIKIRQIYIMINFIIGGLIIALMLTINPENIAYYGGMFMVYFSGYLLVELKFKYATIAGWTIFIIHFLGVLIFYGVPSLEVNIGGFFLVGANIIGMIGSYGIEKSNQIKKNQIEEINLLNEELNVKNIEALEQVDQLEKFIKENQELNFKYSERTQLIEELVVYKEITEQAKFGSALSDLNGVLIYVNQAFCDMHGYSKNELINQHILMVHSEDQSSLVYKLLEQMKETDSFISEEVWHLKKDGSTFPTIMSGKLIYIDNVPKYFSSTMIDISKEKQAQIDLAKSRTQFDKLLSENDIPVANHKMIYDDNGNAINYEFLYVNSAFEKLMGLKKSEIIGKTVLDLLPNTEKYWIMEYDVVAKTQKPKRYENYSQVFNKWFSASVYSPEVGQFAVLITDISELKEKENLLEYIAIHDDLTKLPNRRYFEQKLKELDHLKYYPLLISMVDFDGLKLINDAFGHKVGDNALIQISRIININIRNQDFLSRIGGDEFVIICPNTTLTEFESIKSKIIKQIGLVKYNEMTFSLSFGEDVKLNETVNIDDVLKTAENNMYANKTLHNQSARNETIMTLFEALKEKYDEEKIHSDRVSYLCKHMGLKLKLGLEQVKELEFAGLMHDIGKITIPDSILDKPGKLTDEEWVIMKKHTINGYQILRSANKYSRLAEYALTHHERWDGKGYPNGLSGEDIPLFSRIISIADAYEAMTSDRPYRKALSKDFAITELRKCAGSQFDESLIEIFINEVIPIE